MLKQQQNQIWNLLNVQFCDGQGQQKINWSIVYQKYWFYIQGDIFEAQILDPIYLINNQIQFLKIHYVQQYIFKSIIQFFQMKDITLDEEIKKDKQRKKTANKNPTKKTKQIRRPKFIRTRKQQKPRPFKRRPPPLQRIQRLPAKETQRHTNYDDRKLKVMGIHPDITSEDLYKLFSEQGALQVCRVDQDNFGRSQTTATVIYYSPQNAQQAIANLNKHKIMNSIITVEKWKKQVKPKQRVFNQQNTNRQLNRNRNFKNRSNERGGFRKKFNKNFNRRQR